jgi:hypothetical protein
MSAGSHTYTVAEITFKDTSTVAELTPDQMLFLSIGLTHNFGVRITEARPPCGGIWLHHVTTGAMLLRKPADTVAKVWTAAGHMDTCPLPRLPKYARL